jgi:hypothetical protein
MWDETNCKLSLFSSVYVSPEMVQWLPQFFAREALVQVTNAEMQSVTLSEILGGKPDFLPSGKNNSPDDILEVVNEVYAPAGKNRSRWHDTEEFVKFAETYGSSDVCFGIGDKSGLTLETPFGDDSALIRLRSEIEHPQLGSGLFVTVQIPFTAEEISKEVAWLNFLEARLWTSRDRVDHERVSRRIGGARPSLPGRHPSGTHPNAHTGSGSDGERAPMDSEQLRAHLAQAERHVAECRGHIARQRQVVEQLSLKDESREEAVVMLTILEDSLRILGRMSRTRDRRRPRAAGLQQRGHAAAS